MSKKEDQKLDLVAEDITVVELQDDLVEKVEVSDEETIDSTGETVSEAAEAAKEVNGEKANAETKASIEKSKPAQAAAPKTKAGLINAAYQQMSKMTKEELTSIYDSMVGIQEESEDADQATEVVAEASTEEAVAEEVKIDFTEDLNALVSEQADLSEEFKDKAAVIFEAAVKSKLSAEIERLEEAYTVELSEEVEQIKTDLVEKVDGYLSYVVESWMEENKLAVEAGIRAELAESFIQGLKGLFEQHYVEVPETKYDLVDDLATQVSELEEQLNKATEDSIKLSEEVTALRREAIIAEAADGMVEIDAAKLKTLVEDVDFETAETFAKKVTTIKEAYFKAKKAEVIDESVSVATDEKGEELGVSSGMSRYVSALSRTIQK